MCSWEDLPPWNHFFVSVWTHCSQSRFEFDVLENAHLYYTVFLLVFFWLVWVESSMWLNFMVPVEWASVDPATKCSRPYSNDFFEKPYSPKPVPEPRQNNTSGTWYRISQVLFLLFSPCLVQHSNHCRWSPSESFAFRPLNTETSDLFDIQL